MLRISHEVKDINPKELIELFSKVGWIYCDEESSLLERLRRSYKVMALFDDNKLIGFGRVVSDGVSVAILWDICVDPDYQGKGYGGSIVTTLENICKLNEVETSIVTVKNENIRFYKNRGYVKQKLSVMYKSLWEA